MAVCIGKNAVEQVRVEAVEFRGRRLVNARVWYEAGPDDWRPTKKGLALSPELARKVAEAMLAVCDEIEEAGEPASAAQGD